MCCVGGGDKFEAALQKEIERQLKKSKGDNRKEFKLLLLGTGESGKSTILKQMRIIYGEGFDQARRQSYTAMVYRNLLRAMRAIAHAIESQSLDLDSGLASTVARLTAVTDEEYTELSAADVAFFGDLWSAASVQKVWARKAEFSLPDSTSYFHSHLDRIGAQGYIPTTEDVLRAREATTGIHEYTFDPKRGNILFRMIDVGGQRSERRKWIHCFENVTSIVFIVASSEYDQMLVEDRSINRMEESLLLFQHIVTYDWFRKATFILFLNKRDLLEEKVKAGKSSIRDHFPSFARDPTKLDDVQDFIKNMYEEKAPPGAVHKRVFSHYTQATDTENITFVFSAVRNTIMQGHLGDYNIT